jgi:hypothetical protein
MIPAIFPSLDNGEPAAISNSLSGKAPNQSRVLSTVMLLRLNSLAQSMQALSTFRDMLTLLQF